MEKTTMQFALGVLDSQLEYALEYDRTDDKRASEQMAYYEGLLKMAEIFISSAFTTKDGIFTPEYSVRRGHRVQFQDGSTLFADDET